MSKQLFEQAGGRNELTFDWTSANSPTGIGGFSAAYSPQSKQLNINIKTFVEFSDYDQKWNPQDQPAWQARAFSAVEDFWSDRFLIECTRPGWEEYKATVKVNLIAQQREAGSHLKLGVTKATPSIGTQGGGVGGWNTGIATCNIDDLAAYPKDQRALRAKIFNMRLFQLQKKMQELDLSVIEFAKDSDDFGLTSRTKLAELGRFIERISSDDVTGIRISVWGSTGSGDTFFQTGRGQSRANAVANEIKRYLSESNKDMVHPKTSTSQATLKTAVKAAIKAKNKGNNTTKLQGVVILVHVPESVIQEAEKDYIVICHEYGHMLGLPDEYRGNLHPNLTTRVNLDSLIPQAVDLANKTGDPNTWSDTTKRLRGQQEGMAGMAAQQPDILLPITMGQNQVIDNVSVGSSSIMYGGMQIWPAHYLTIWSALGQCTRNHINPAHWHISPSPRNTRGTQMFR